MSDFDPQELALRTFLRLRNRFRLGVGEYLAALAAIDGGFGADADALADTLKVLWCDSLGAQSQFEPIWQAVQAQVSAQKRRKPPFPGGRRIQSSPQKPGAERQELDNPTPQPDQRSEHQADAELGSLPVQVPDLWMGDDDLLTLQTYHPISRRLMVYNWRYLRRPVADGPLDQLDIAMTIQQVTRQGFYLKPVYKRRMRNDARLLLLLDQNGSMTPFHHFTRDLAETLQQDSTLAPEHVRIFYFQNVPSGSVFKDAYLTQPLSMSAVLNDCDAATSVLLVSDGGAARGYRTRDRIRGTARSLYQMKRYTSLIAWLNPMPRKRWIGSSAEVIANSVPMFSADSEGLTNAVDILRGQPLRPGAAL